MDLRLLDPRDGVAPRRPDRRHAAATRTPTGASRWIDPAPRNPDGGFADAHIDAPVNLVRD
ncbi:MAG TPA: hypothetical protein VEO94_02735 [Candidatus Dormibacteraeota bacterium]|nr:hypothetical protein [Candidatus Dormibacteraeota bacterium]